MMNSGGGRSRKPRGANMSHGNTRYNRGGRDRSHQDRAPVEATGIYADAKYAHLLTSVLGLNVKVRTPSNTEYEGILESVSHDNSFVLGLVNPVDPERPDRIDPEEVREKLIFRTDQIVTIHCRNVDMDYASKSGFATDSSITGRTNGSGAQRELQPWVSGEEEATPDQLVSLEEANGWDPREMFLKNERVYGVRSTYDQTLAGYTVPLEQAPSEQAERAARIAQEIERSSVSRQRADMENGDEEAAFAAVSRAGGGDGRGDRYSSMGRRPLRDVGPRHSPRGGPPMGPRPRGPSDRGHPMRSQGYHGRDMRDGRDMHDLRDMRNPRDMRDPRDGRDSRDMRDGRDPRDRDNREYRDMRDGRDYRDGRDPRDGRDMRDYRDGRDRGLRDGRDNREMQGRETRDGREHRDREYREARDSRDPRGGPPPTIHTRGSPAAAPNANAGASDVRPAAAPSQPAQGSTPAQSTQEPAGASNEASPALLPKPSTTAASKEAPPPAEPVLQKPPPPLMQTPQQPPPTQPTTESSRLQRSGDVRVNPTNSAPPARGPTSSSTAKAVAGLKDFQENFVLSEEPPKTPAAEPQKPRASATAAATSAEPTSSTSTASTPSAATSSTPPTSASPSTPTGAAAAAAPDGKLAESLAKSKLNPNAKEFTMNPQSKPFTPTYTPSPAAAAAAPAVPYSPDPQPVPRAMTPQAALTPGGQLSILGAQPTVGQPTFSYIMGPHSFPVHQPLHQPPRLQKQRGDYGSSMGHRGGEATPMQVAAVTGQPLLAPSPLAAHPPAQQLPMSLQQGGMVAHPYPGAGQMIVRMLPTGPGSMYQPQPQPGPQPLASQPHASAGAYDPQPTPPSGPQSLPYGLLPQPAAQPQPAAVPAGASVPGLMYQLQTPAAAAAAAAGYPPSSMYLVPSGQQVPPQLMMQPQAAAAAAAAAAAVTSSVQTLPLNMQQQLPQQYYFAQQQHPGQQPQPPQPPQYGGPGGHPMPLVPHMNP